MTVKEYNQEFLPKIKHARQFVELLESAIQHMDDTKVDKDEVHKQLQIRCWSEETKQTILAALAYYQQHESIDKIESPLTEERRHQNG